MPKNLPRLLLLAVVCALFATHSAYASLVSLEIEPIVGYERVQKLVPTAHSTDRLTYGARAIVGVPLISAEAQYLRGTDTETFPAQSLTVTDTADRAQLGVRSTLHLLGLLSVYLRAGAQATQNKHTEVSSGVTTTTTQPITYHPYAGVGLKAWLGSKFALTADITTVFPNFPKMDHNEYQTTAGFTVHLP